MSLFSVMNPSDFRGLQVHAPQESSGPIAQERTSAPRRSAQPRSHQPTPSTSRAAGGRPAQARAGRTRGVTKHRPASRAHAAEQSLRRTRLHGDSGAQAGTAGPRDRPRRSDDDDDDEELALRERIRRARAAAECSGRGRGRHVSIMDVVLDAQAPTARLDADDLLDAIEQHQRAALARPSAEDDLLADMFVPGRYEARQRALWREAAAALEYWPKSLYHVSAERTTAAWDAASDSGGSEPL